MSLKEKIFKFAPFFTQDLAITAYNTYQYKIRHGGVYRKYSKYYAAADYLNQDELTKEIESKKSQFFNYVKTHSSWYKDYNFDDFSSLPILEKKDLISNLNKIKTIEESQGLINLTSGTTGSSLKTIYMKSDMQERFAILDHFKSKHGFNIGRKTAWFSGKNLITDKHIAKGICSHYDFFNKFRFYSTFHINKKNFNIYWRSLNQFQPEFIVGFPSSVYEICKVADSQGLKLENSVKVFFTTSETVLPEHKDVIGRVLGCKLVDQYASSEGAPFIYECEHGNMHIHPLTGIFEVVDENMKPSNEGEIIVTSFTTFGTPLIRYRIGDRIKLADENKKCECGSLFPIVDKIDGRTKDFIYSPEKGIINLVNIGNSSKGLKGIVCFQVIQDTHTEITVKLVVTNGFDNQVENKFINAIRERVGKELSINIEYVDDIPREKSGKFRIVKNNLKLGEL